MFNLYHSSYRDSYDASVAEALSLPCEFSTTGGHGHTSAKGVTIAAGPTQKPPTSAGRNNKCLQNKP